MVEVLEFAGGHRASEGGFGQGAEQGPAPIRNNGRPVRILAISRSWPLVEWVESVPGACAKLNCDTAHGLGHHSPLALGIARDVDPSPEGH